MRKVQYKQNKRCSIIFYRITPHPPTPAVYLFLVRISLVKRHLSDLFAEKEKIARFFFRVDLCFS